MCPLIKKAGAYFPNIEWRDSPFVRDGPFKSFEAAILGIAKPPVCLIFNYYVEFIVAVEGGKRLVKGLLEDGYYLGDVLVWDETH